MKWLLLLAALAGFSPDRQIPGPRLVRRPPAPPRLVVGHGFAVWEHADGSCEMFDGRTVYSGVFIAGPRQNWWPDGRHLKKKGKP
jgi:hypothetical protein